MGLYGMRQLGILENRRILRVLDSFNRADSITTLGRSDTGQLWEAVRGVWGVSNNKAYLVSSGGATNIETIDTKHANITISSDLVFQTYAGIAFRLTDVSNYMLARLSSTGLSLYSVVINTPTEIGNYTFTPVPGNTYKIKISAIDSNIIVYLDDIERISITSNFNITATKHGFRQLTNIDDRYDNFKVEVA